LGGGADFTLAAFGGASPPSSGIKQ